MDNKKLNLFLTTCVAFTLFAILWIPVSALSEGSVNRFSFRFENCSVSDALSEISAKSGISITSKSAVKKEISMKSYVNRHLDSIITDLLKGEDCAVVWNYNAGNLHSIDLYTFDENDVKRTGSGAASINRSNSSSPQVNRSTREINQTRNGSFNSSSSRSNRVVSPARASAQRNSSGNKTSQNNPIYSRSARTISGENSSPDISRVSANMRRAVINNQDTEPEDETGEEEEANITEPTPEEPEPEKGSGLERPPMPPGL